MASDGHLIFLKIFFSQSGAFRQRQCCCKHLRTMAAARKEEKDDNVLSSQENDRMTLAANMSTLADCAKHKQQVGEKQMFLGKKNARRSNKF
jgi:hypothetical protein